MRMLGYLPSWRSRNASRCVVLEIQRLIMGKPRCSLALGTGLSKVQSQTICSFDFQRAYPEIHHLRLAPRRLNVPLMNSYAPLPASWPGEPLLRPWLDLLSNTNLGQLLLIVSAMNRQ